MEHKKISFDSGNWYEGFVVCDVLCGEGEYFWTTTGSRYKGNFENGKPSGAGTFYFSDGAVYEGQFFEGSFHGIGKKTEANGEVSYGKWSNNRFSRPLPLPKTS